MTIRLSALALGLALIAAPELRAATLFADLGERSGLERIIDRATEIWTKDPAVAATFDDTNLPRFKRLFVDQLCQLTGGGCTYTGRAMHEAHKGLHLDTRQFNVVVEDLQVAMDELNVPFSTQNRLLALLAPMYRDVVSK
ncbi:MAG: group 1 truncated hemoglobin [Acetobacteraceae bacterium]